LQTLQVARQAARQRPREFKHQRLKETTCVYLSTMQRMV
jgi:hypothetical protein